MSHFVVDVEADGPCPGLYSMISFGVVKIVKEPMKGYSIGPTFYGQCEPISDIWIPDALAVSGFSREEVRQFENPVFVMPKFDHWIKQNRDRDRSIFLSDNPAFDWQFMNYYMHRFTGNNPFGFSARRIGDFYAGLRRQWKDQSGWKRLRKTPHTHNPVDDAIGNAEALISFSEKFGVALF